MRVEVIEWLVAQPWCSGAVGMMGIYVGGFNQIQLSPGRPQPHKAIVTHLLDRRSLRVTMRITWAARCSTPGLGWPFYFFGSMCLDDRYRYSSVTVGGGCGWSVLRNVSLSSIFGCSTSEVMLIGITEFGVRGLQSDQMAGVRRRRLDSIYTNGIPRLLERLTVPRKGLIGPWAHTYPHFALPGTQIGFLQEMLRWWDYWLKGVDTGVMDERMLRAWMTESVKPAPHHEVLPGRWIAEPSWPPRG